MLIHFNGEKKLIVSDQGLVDRGLVKGGKLREKSLSKKEKIRKVSRGWWGKDLGNYAWRKYSGLTNRRGDTKKSQVGPELVSFHGEGGKTA